MTIDGVIKSLWCGKITLKRGGLSRGILLYLQKKSICKIKTSYTYMEAALLIRVMDGAVILALLSC